MTRHSALKLLIFYCISFLISQLPLYPVTLSLQSRMSLQIFTFLLGPIYLILISHLLIAILPVPLRTALNFLDLIGPRKHRGLVTGGCLLGLEIMTLLVCIIVLAPLPAIISQVFILTITGTCLVIVLSALIQAFQSAYHQDKDDFQKKQDLRKKAALASHQLVLETDPKRRQAYLRLPKYLTLLFCPAIFMICTLILYMTRDEKSLPAIQWLRLPVTYLAGLALFALLPLSMYWLNCQGTSLVQRIYIDHDQLYYYGYSGSMEERRESTYQLVSLQSFRVYQRAIHIRGSFRIQTQDRYGLDITIKKKALWIPRTFPVEQEESLLQFLNSINQKKTSVEQ